MSTSSHVLEMPMWLFGLRIGQVVLSIILLGLAAATGSGYGIGDAPALAIACAIFTWIIVAYNIVTVRVPKFNEFYHIIAILALDAFMIIMWLATWARAADVAAALGAASRYYSIFERSLETRALSWTAYKGIYGALAGLGALMWLSWIGTFVFTLMAYLKGKKEGRFPLNNNPTTSEAHQMEEAKAQPAAAPAAQPVYAAPQPGYEQNPYEAPQAHPQQHQQ